MSDKDDANNSSDKQFTGEDGEYIASASNNSEDLIGTDSEQDQYPSKMDDSQSEDDSRTYSNSQTTNMDKSKTSRVVKQSRNINFTEKLRNNRKK